MLAKHKTLTNKTIIKQESARSERNKWPLISEPISKLPFFRLFLFLKLEISAERAASVLASVSQSCSLGAARLWMSLSTDQVSTAMEWQGARDNLTGQINPGHQWVTDVLARSPPQQCWPHGKCTTLYLIFPIFILLYKWCSACIRNQSYTLSWMLILDVISHCRSKPITDSRTNVTSFAILGNSSETHKLKVKLF